MPEASCSKRSPYVCTSERLAVPPASGKQHHQDRGWNPGGYQACHSAARCPVRDVAQRRRARERRQSQSTRTPCARKVEAMTPGDELAALYEQWRTLTEDEGRAIAAEAWTNVEH